MYNSCFMCILQKNIFSWKLCKKLALNHHVSLHNCFVFFIKLLFGDIRHAMGNMHIIWCTVDDINFISPGKGNDNAGRVVLVSSTLEVVMSHQNNNSTLS